MTYRDKVKQGIIVRLKNIQPYIDHWDQAMAWMVHPANLAFAHRILLEFTDHVLKAAEDKSVDVRYVDRRWTGTITDIS